MLLKVNIIILVLVKAYFVSIELSSAQKSTQIIIVSGRKIIKLSFWTRYMICKSEFVIMPDY